jgi:hypothetical protein
MDALQFRRPAALVYLSMRDKGREIVRHGLAAVPPSQHCGTTPMGADHVRLTHPGRRRGAAGRERSARRRGDRYAIGRSMRFRGAEIARGASGGDPGRLRDIMEVDGQDVRLERAQERLARLLSRSNKALRDMRKGRIENPRNVLPGAEQRHFISAAGAPRLGPRAAWLCASRDHPLPALRRNGRIAFFPPARRSR